MSTATSKPTRRKPTRHAPSPERLFRAIFGSPRRRYALAPRSFVIDGERCRMGSVSGGVYELAYDPKTHSYRVTVLRTTRTTHGIGIDRDREHDRVFSATEPTQALILRARDEAIDYLRTLGATIPDVLPR